MYERMSLLLLRNDLRELAVAKLIRQKTSMSIKWIREHLEMRSADNASQQIHRVKRLNDFRNKL